MKRKEVLYCACLMLMLSFCSYLFYRNLVLLIFFPLLYGKGKKLLEQYLQDRKKKRMLTEFRDFLFSLSTSFSTGRHMAEGLQEAETYLAEIYGNDSILCDRLRKMLEEMLETGKTDLEVLRHFAQEVKLEDVQNFADVFAICRETGGDIYFTVNRAATLIGEKIQTEQEIQTMIAQKKFEGRVIAVMPFAMLFFLQLVSPAYLEVMYTTAAGRLVMTIALVIQLVTVFWIERMTSIEV